MKLHVRHIVHQINLGGNVCILAVKLAQAYVTTTQSSSSYDYGVPPFSYARHVAHQTPKRIAETCRGRGLHKLGIYLTLKSLTLTVLPTYEPSLITRTICKPLISGIVRRIAKRPVMHIGAAFVPVVVLLGHQGPSRHRR